MVEEMTTKMSDAQGLEMERLAEEEKILQTLEVILTALGVGSFTWGYGQACQAVLRGHQGQGGGGHGHGALHQPGLG